MAEIKENAGASVEVRNQWSNNLQILGEINMEPEVFT